MSDCYNLGKHTRLCFAIDCLPRISHFANCCNRRKHLHLTLLEHKPTTHHTYILKNSQLVFLPFEVSLYHRTKRQVNGKNYCSKYTTHEQSHSIQRVAVFVIESHHVLPIKCNNFFFFADFREAVYKCLQRRAYFSGT